MDILGIEKFGNVSSPNVWTYLGFRSLEMYLPQMYGTYLGLRSLEMYPPQMYGTYLGLRSLEMMSWASSDMSSGMSGQGISAGPWSMVSNSELLADDRTVRIHIV
jgi:hypothetical protein